MSPRSVGSGSCGWRTFDADAVAAVVARLPGTFHTKDVSEAEEVVAAHPGAGHDSAFPGLVGRRLSTDRVKLGIVEAGKSGKRGTRWHKQQPAQLEAPVLAAPHGPAATPLEARVPRAGAVGALPWDDTSLAVGSDSPRKARYRLLQSWYREVVLSVPPGFFRGRLVGSRLDVAAVRERPGLNFLE